MPAVTPADVHDAIPLVVDYAPSRVAGLTSGSVKA